MDADNLLRAGPTIAVARSEMRFRFDRSSGPGGQNVNKVNSKATMHWNVADSPSIDEAVRARFLQRFATRINSEGEVVISSQRYRDQPRNTEDCLSRLQQMLLEVAQAPTKRRKRRVSLAAKRRRVDEKKRRSQVKQLRRPPKDH